MRDILIVGGGPAGMMTELMANGEEADPLLQQIYRRRIKSVRRFPGRIIGLGFGREDSQSPEAQEGYFQLSISASRFERMASKNCSVVIHA